MKFQSPSMLLITVLVVAALASSTSTTLDKPTASPCGDMLNKACNNNICKNGDIKCALQCFEKFNEAIMDTKSKDCQISSDALDVLKMAVEWPETFAELLKHSEIAAVYEATTTTTTVKTQKMISSLFDSNANNTFPTVLAHGMGDSCFNGGMKEITKDVGTHIGTYSVCVPTGDTWLSDTINGFLLQMDKSVDVFAKKIAADPKLANGFNAIGFSQGNSLIRGYIQKYNDPPINFVLHVHGTVSGVAGFPQCDPTSSFCKGVAHLCGSLAYNSLIQGILFQADYFRDPTKVNSTAYKKNSQLAQWNNEGLRFNKQINVNFAKTKKFVMVKALGDTMVFPNEGEWFGHYKDGDDDYKTVLRMNETEWYKSDLFGLKTADEAGKIHFESTPGNHLQFTEKELFGWIDEYFV